jgi:hypothetical protein
MLLLVPATTRPLSQSINYILRYQSRRWPRGCRHCVASAERTVRRRHGRRRRFSTRPRGAPLLEHEQGCSSPALTGGTYDLDGRRNGWCNRLPTIDGENHAEATERRRVSRARRSNAPSVAPPSTSELRRVSEVGSVTGDTGAASSLSRRLVEFVDESHAERWRNLWTALTTERAGERGEAP